MSRYIEKRDETEERRLQQVLRSGERLIAYLHVSGVRFPQGRKLPRGRVRWRYLLTGLRSALVSFPKKGEAAVFELPCRALGVTDSLGRDEVTIAAYRWKTSLGNDGLHREVSSLAGLDCPERLREAARLAWVKPDQEGERRRWARDVLAELCETADDPLDHLGHLYVSQVLASAESEGEDDAEPATATEAATEGACLADEEIQGELEACLTPLVEDANAGERLLAWAKDWAVGPRERLAIVRVLTADDRAQPRAARAALGLHRHARADILGREKDPAQRSVLDIAFAEHLLQVDERTEARMLLERRLARLPDESVAALLPPKDLDLTEGGSEVLRIRLLELHAEACGEGHSPDVAVTAELARLQPLVIERVRTLAELAATEAQEPAAVEPLGARASRIGDLLEQGPPEFSRVPEPPSVAELQSIDPELVDGLLPHPAARQGGVFERLQTWLGEAKRPDHVALRSFAERMGVEAFPVPIAALMDAALVLGVPAVEAYVSRGERATGIRAYESDPPFLVVGADHLDADSEHFIPEAALRFVVASEMGHVRFEHTRLTSQDVWDGVFSKGTQLLETVGTLAGPLGLLGGAIAGLRRFDAIARLVRQAETVSKGAAKAVDYVSRARGLQQGGDVPALPEGEQRAGEQEQLLAACRVMQLTADRAGLVVGGDVEAAVRAILESSRRGRAELPMIARHGLSKALNRRDKDDALVNQQLAIRLAALLSFYLSDEFEKLRTAALVAPG